MLRTGARAALAALLALTALALAAAPATAAPSWQPEETMPASGDGRLSTFGAQAHLDARGVLTVAYFSEAARTDFGTYWGVFSRRRAADGTWEAPQELTRPEDRTNYTDFRLHLAGNAAGDVAVVYEVCPPGSSFCMLGGGLRGADDAEWSDPVVVSDLAPEGGVHDRRPSLAVDAAGVATVAWEHRIDPNADRVLQVRKLAPGPLGTTSVDAVRTLQAAGPANHVAETPQVAHLGDGRAVVAWLSRGRSGTFCRRVAVAVEDAAGAFGAPQEPIAKDCASQEDYQDSAGEPQLAASGAGVAGVFSHVDVQGEDGMTSVPTTQAFDVGLDGAVSAPATVAPFALSFQSQQHDATAARRGIAGNAAGAALITGYDESRFDNGAGLIAISRDAAGGTWQRTELLDVGFSRNRAPLPAVGPDGTMLVAWEDMAENYGPVESWVARRVPGAAAFGAPVQLSSGATTEPRYAANQEPLPLLGGGAPAVLWTVDEETWEVALKLSHFAEPPAAGPTASFEFAPAAPRAGDLVTFTSTSAAGAEPIAEQAWDLDDDGEFGEPGETGAEVRARFAASGTYRVELRVRDAADRRGDAFHDVVVSAAPVPDEEEEEEQQPPPPAAGHGDPAPPTSPPPAAAPPEPFAFQVGQAIDTTGSRKMPAVSGRDLDAAKAKIVRGVVHADIATDAVRKPAKALGKRPGGGRWVIGDVIAQTPAAGSAHVTSTTQPLAVRLTYWAGEKSDRERCDDLRAALKSDELQFALEQLRAAGCAKKPDVVVVPAKKQDEPEVSKATGKTGGVLTVKVPSDPAKLDITTWMSSGVIGSPNPGPAAEDFTLTAGQDNVLGVLLFDRAQRRLAGATVRVDLHEVGGKDFVGRTTDGAFATTIRPQKAGTVHVFSEWADAKGERIYGYAAFKVVQRTAASFTTALGKTYVLQKKGNPRYVLGSAKAARAANAGQFFAWVSDCLRSLGGAVAAAATATAEGLVRTARETGASALQLWRGGTTTSGPAEIGRGAVWRIQPNGVVAAGSANVVAGGGGNLIGAAGGNLIGAAGGNLIGAAGGNLVVDGKAGVIAAGSANLIALPDGSKVGLIGAAGGNIVSDNGLGVVAAGSANVLAR